MTRSPVLVPTVALSFALACPSFAFAESAPVRGPDWNVPSILPWRFGLAVDGGVGSAPAMAPGVSLQAGTFEFGGFLGLEARYAFRGAESFAGSELGVSLATASIVACRTWPVLELCLLGGGGTYLADQPSSAGRSEAFVPLGFAGGRVALRFEPSTESAWALEGSLTVPFTPLVLPLGGAEAWRAGVVGFTLGLRYTTTVF